MNGVIIYFGNWLRDIMERFAQTVKHGLKATMNYFVSVRLNLLCTDSLLSMQRTMTNHLFLLQKMAISGRC